MFTGIVTALGRLRGREILASDGRLTIECPQLDLGDVALGDSIAVNGVCLTVAALAETGFDADVSIETLERSCLGELPLGSALNLEKAATLNTRLGGHIVTGHVDGVGTVIRQYRQGRSQCFVIQAPAEIMRFIAEKGSIAVDGVSLTVNNVEADRFELVLIPHTLSATIVAQTINGRRVHLEVDIMARYVERLLQSGTRVDPGAKPRDGIALSTLAEHGFLN